MGRKKRKKAMRSWKSAVDCLLGRKGTKRICIACLGQFWQKNLAEGQFNLMEQFCTEKCKGAFFKGYDLGLRAAGQVAKWPKMGPQGGK